MIVSQILKAKGSDVATIAPDARVADAAARLANGRIGALVVSGGGGAIAGIISERDIVRALAVAGATALDSRVETLMSRNVATCAPADSLESLMREMTARRVRHLPVVKEGRLAGIVSIGDVVKHRLDELERERAMLVSYVASG
ncbi:MAG: CBS domain-containing protein [Alphaproteobacteria bacterium]